MANDGTMRAIGLMSGTSLDGIDIALIETDGLAKIRRIAAATEPYPPEFRAMLRQALAEATDLSDRAARPGRLGTIEAELTDRHATALGRFMAGRGLGADDVDVVGFHGQTVLHRPERRLTVQLGDGPRLARMVGIDVVYDLRAADCAAGGQGAPLVPVYHRALAAQIPDRPLAVLNVGGVANVTWIGPAGDLVAFDTGPGNALLDDWALRHTGRPVDVDGRLAAAGRVDTARVAAALSHPYFGKPAPKSLDRNDFTAALVHGLDVADGAATLVAVTVAAVAAAQSAMLAPPRRWVVAGGGRRNPVLMAGLVAALDAPVVAAEAVGWDGDGLEAESWAYLAVLSRLGRPISFPGTTGVAAPLTGGVLARRPHQPKAL